MFPPYITALQAVLNKFETTFFDIEMTAAIATVRTTGNTLKPIVARPFANPEFYRALVPYVKAVELVLSKFEKTFYDEDMTSRIKKAKITGDALFPPASKITRPEDENGDNYGYWTNPYNNYLPYDVRYKKAVKYVFEKFESTFFDVIMFALIKTLQASE
jgi:hypothetical protein